MPHASCRPDPVELLLRNVLQRTLLLAGSAALASCSTALDAGELGGDGHSAQDPDQQRPTADAGGSGPGVPVGTPPRDAGRSQGAVDASVFVPDASVVFDAGAPSGPRDAASDVFVPPPTPSTLGPALSCAASGVTPIQASGLKPVQSYDYLAIRRVSDSWTPVPDGGVAGDAGPPAENWVPTRYQVLSETGSMCATAQGSDCASKAASHPEQFVKTGCGQICWEDSVVTTRGNEVKRWAGPDALKALLGTIDSGDEALLMVAAAGYSLSCGKPEETSWRSVSGGYEVFATRMTKDCAPIQLTRFHLLVSSSGDLTVLGSLVLRETDGCAGRKPAGLVSRSVAVGQSKLGDYLARMAHLEAASVFAFERLARELRDHGAPLGLIRAALEARADEVRHSHQIGHLALAHGGALVAPEITDSHVRTLEEIALENAVEGCVRETFGALIGAFQAEHAEDEELKSAMVAIAEEEARHAALSHRVQHWLEPRLSPDARERVRHARERAVFELAREIALEEDAELRRAAGLPTPEMARILLEELTKTLWRSPFDMRHLKLA